MRYFKTLFTGIRILRICRSFLFLLLLLLSGIIVMEIIAFGGKTKIHFFICVYDFRFSFTHHLTKHLNYKNGSSHILIHTYYYLIIHNNYQCIFLSNAFAFQFCVLFMSCCCHFLPFFLFLFFYQCSADLNLVEFRILCSLFMRCKEKIHWIMRNCV